MSSIMMPQNMSNEVIEMFYKKSILLDSESLNIIKSKKDILEYSKKLLQYCEKNRIYKVTTETINSFSTTVKNSVELKIMVNNISPEGKWEKVNDAYEKYFNSRYEKIKNIINKKPSMRFTTSISTAKKRGGNVAIIAMIYSITADQSDPTKNIISMEDPTGFIKGIVNKNVYEKNPLTTDSIVGIKGSLKQNSNFITIDEIIYPGIEFKNINKTSKPMLVGFLSDIHVGSKHFLSSKWDDLVDFINNPIPMENGSKEKMEAFFIAGDLVDGVGIYQNQEEDLEILEIEKQYEKLAELIKKINPNIKIYLMPGNHDIVRPVEPQPILPKEIQEIFPENCIFISNPSTINIENVKILIYHGRTFDDLVGTIKDMTYSTPTIGMEYMLKSRSLLAMYGNKTPISPLFSTWDIIDSIPDIFVTGHIHYHEIVNKYNVTFINASTWQSQTAFQKMHNFNPKPCILSLVELQSRNTYIKNFMK